MSTQPPENGPDEEHQPSIATGEDEYPVDRWRARMNDSLAGRPLTVYLVLFAGAATLLLLLVVVWISARGGGDHDELICTEIAPADARAAVFNGQISRINILVDKDDPIQSLTGVQLRFTDGTCRQTPQGAGIREELLGIIGAVDLYNNYSDSSIRKHYQGQDIELELLITPTPSETIAPTATNTPVTPTATSPPPTETPNPTATPSPTVTRTPAARSAASPTSNVTPSVDGGQRAPVGNPGS